MSADNENPKPALSAGDVLYVLFRHKWKIVALSCLGFVTAGIIFFNAPATYQSTAKLLVRYVMDSRADVSVAGDRQQIRSLDGGANIINSELQILRSRDLAEAAVDAVGAAKILAEFGGGESRDAAASVVLSGVIAEVPSRSNVIIVGYQHRNPATAREVLRALVRLYLEKHAVAHSATDTFGFLQQQTDQWKSRLIVTEEDLRKLKSEADIVSLPDAQQSISAQMTALRREIYQTEATVAENRARMGHASGGATSTNGTESAISPITDRSEYNDLVDQLKKLRGREADLAAQFTTENVLLKHVRRQIEQVEQKKKEWEEKNPMIASQTSNTGNPALGVELLFQANNEQAALEAKLKLLNEQLLKEKARATKLDALDARLTELQRRKHIEETNYMYFSINLEQAKIDDALDSGKASNISIIQTASVPSRNVEKTQKVALGVLGGGLGLGLVLAFLIEFFIDQTVKRPKDIDRLLQLPLFASIPRLSFSKPIAKLNDSNPGALTQGAHSKLTNGGIAPWDQNDPMRPYYEAVKDRLVMSYNGDVHKPKIVGFTSCNKGAGVSRLAAGVAAALSRDMERRVLFIGLERERVAITAFEKGAPGISDGNGHGAQDASALDQNLYSLARTAPASQGASIVQRFTDLIPKLRVSEYDYIIFDLPPISQTSGSLRLATQMERTLLVIEAEKTQKEKVERAKKLLHAAHANLFAVLNKTRTYGPKELNEVV